MILLIDNYDSFSYNLAQMFGALGVDVIVRRYQEVTGQRVLDRSGEAFDELEKRRSGEGSKKND